MEWLNYHHLRYFWMVAKEGSLARAAEKLHVSQPAISEQIGELENAMGEKLFQRKGRNNRLTDSGQVAFGYAEEIFSLGAELIKAIKHHPGVRVLRLQVGIADSFPKLVTSEILKPLFSLDRPVHVICREGKLEDLLVQLAAHRLDLVLSEEPASSTAGFNSFSHPLCEAGLVLCAEQSLARKLRKGFPGSLDNAPALLPAQNTFLRRELDKWFHEKSIRPAVTGDFEDLALMKVVAAEGRGFIALPEIALEEAVKRYSFSVIGRPKNCSVRFFAITAERRIIHPGVTAIINNAKRVLGR